MGTISWQILMSFVSQVAGEPSLAVISRVRAKPRARLGSLNSSKALIRTPRGPTLPFQ